MDHRPALLRGVRHLALLLTTLAAAACASRSISDPSLGYGRNRTYAGELSEFQVVGTEPGDTTQHGDVVLRRGQRLLVVQSGAAFPDERLLGLLGAHFEVGAASGIPNEALGREGMRHAAARGGFDAIVAYWGVLESSERATPGAVASWVPIAGWFVPDSKHRVRIRLRAVVVDTETGRWKQLRPAPIEDERHTSMASREYVDSDQVEALIGAAAPTLVALLTSDLGDG